MGTIVNPHDKFFRELFTDKKKAKDFLVSFLPKDIARLVDLDDIEIVKDSFIDEGLHEYFSDILYKVTLAKKRGYFYILFEHKSYQYRLTPLQLLGYMDKIWKLEAKQKHGEFLPIIIPLVFYHGKEKWAVSERFSDLFGDVPEEVRRFIPEFSYTLYDLSQYSDDALKNIADLNVALLLFKHIFNERFTEKFEEIISLFRELDDTKNGPEYFRIVIRYILNAAEGVSINELKNIIDKSISTEKGGEVMTIAEQLMQEGEQRGLQKGLQKGLQEGRQEGRQDEVRECVLDALEIKFGIVPGDIAQRIGGIKNVKILEKLHKDAIKANALDEFINIVANTDIRRN